MLELEKLFGSQEKVRLLRLFFANQDKFFELEEIIEKTKSKKDIVRKLLDQLEKGDIIIKNKKKFAKIIEYSKKKTKHIPPKDYICYEVNKDFRFFNSLSALLFDFPSFDRKELLERFQNIGRIKLFLISGVFLGDEKARADILFVGETINSKSVDLVVSNIIADYGVDLKVVFYDLEEFEYRIKMFDKFIKDVFKHKHEMILNHTKII